MGWELNHQLVKLLLLGGGGSFQSFFPDSWGLLTHCFGAECPVRMSWAVAIWHTHTHYIPRAPKNLYFWRSTLQNKALFKQNTQLIFSRWRSSVDYQINTMNPIVAWDMPKGIMPKGIGTTTNMNRQLLTDTWNVTQFNDVWGTVTGPALHTRNVWNLFVEPFSSWCERSRMDEPILTKIEGPKANFGRAGSDCSRNCSGNCSPMTHLKTHLELQLQTCLV